MQDNDKTLQRAGRHSPPQRIIHATKQRRTQHLNVQSLEVVFLTFINGNLFIIFNNLRLENIVFLIVTVQ